MDVQHIFANDHFGAAFGVLRAHLGGASLAMPLAGSGASAGAHHGALGERTTWPP